MNSYLGLMLRNLCKFKLVYWLQMLNTIVILKCFNYVAGICFSWLLFADCMYCHCILGRGLKLAVHRHWFRKCAQWIQKQYTWS